MPPARKARSSTGPAAKGAQKTLSFGNSKVTKNTTPLGKDKLSSSIALPAKAQAEVLLNADVELDTGHVSSEAAVKQQAQVEVRRVALGKERTAEEERASKVSDAQIKRYWREREAERKAPRVHQGGLAVEEKILRLFDMSSQYGPCIGIARMKRWVRANKLGLAPPIEVLAVLMKEEGKGNTQIERAHIDELMSSKSGAGEV